MNTAQRIQNVEWIEARENEIATFVASIEAVRKMKILARLLLSNGSIDAGYYKDWMKDLENLAAHLQLGKHNTARLRNRGA